MLRDAASTFALIAGIAAIFLAAYVLFRSQTANILRGELDALRDKLKRLESELEGVRTEAHGKDIKIADLLAKTDLTVILANQMEGLKLGVEIEKSMKQMITTMQAMEDRLNRGLIMK